MLDTEKLPRLIKTKHGYYQYSPMPADSDLSDYYANKYYQEEHGSYSVSYTDEEIAYFKLKASLLYRKLSHFISAGNGKRFVDIGCGEGWVMDEFIRKGYLVTGFDFSNHGIKKCNPHLLDFVEQGDIYDLLIKKKGCNDKFDILMIANVIEHVTDPVRLLHQIKEIMMSDAILIIIAPNDFSPLHELLLEKGKINKRFWLSYPDHLSYFNKESMESLLSDIGFNVLSVVADNPVDLNLLNDNSNYIEDTSKGKNTHLFRVSTDNFLGSLDADKLLRIYEILGSMGVGRDLNFFCAISR